MTKMTYLGHGSLRFEASGGQVIYLDPYGGDDYGPAADLVLVTHQHHDHNAVEKVTLKPDARIITEADALKDGRHGSFDLGWVQVDAVLAHNRNHDPRCCVGYVIHLDGLKIYCAGDTSSTNDMTRMKDIDYALLPIDGIYNMGPEEATACAELIGARYAIPIHTDPSGYLDEKIARFTPSNRLLVRPGETIEL
jgi:L-ascorbate metabolism protein UlaG (beta-lactamase superfamily)